MFPSSDFYVAQDELMSKFTYSHLPEEKQVISKPFCELAVFIHKSTHSNPYQKLEALKYLMIAKDFAVRACC